MTIHNPWDFQFIDPAGRVRVLERVRTMTEYWSELDFTPLDQRTPVGVIHNTIPWSEKTGLIAQHREDDGWRQHPKPRSYDMHLSDRDINNLRGKFVYCRRRSNGLLPQFFELYASVKPFSNDDQLLTRVRLFNVFSVEDCEDLDIYKDGTPSKAAQKEGFLAMTRERFEKDVVGVNFSTMSHYLFTQTRIPGNEVAIYNQNGLTFERWMRAAGLWDDEKSQFESFYTTGRIGPWMRGEDPSDSRLQNAIVTGLREGLGLPPEADKALTVEDFRHHRFFRYFDEHPHAVYRCDDRGGTTVLFLRAGKAGTECAIVWDKTAKRIAKEFAFDGAGQWSFEVVPPRPAELEENEEPPKVEEPKVHSGVLTSGMVSGKQPERISRIRCPNCKSEEHKSLVYRTTSAAPIALVDGFIEVDRRKESRLTASSEKNLSFLCVDCMHQWPMPEELIYSTRFHDAFTVDLNKVKNGLKRGK